jgi:hypothetical protein
MPHQGHIGRVPIEVANVLLDPMEGRYLVHQPVVGREAHVHVCVRVEKPWEQEKIGERVKIMDT